MSLSLSAKYIQLNSKQAGRDKIYRTVQYACKFLWYFLWKTKSNPEYIKILKKIEATMSETRRVFRFATSFEMIQSARKSIHIEDDFLRYVLTGNNINQAFYLLFDNLLLLNNFGVVKLKDVEKISNWSNKFWLTSIILTLSRDLYDIMNQIESNRNRLNEYNRKHKLKTKTCLLTILNHVHLLVLTNPNLVLDTTKNVCDLFLPLSFLKYVELTPGTQGLLGAISSFIGLMTVWDAKYKLTP